ncbi:MAG: tetratricopeptide repeat protein, partial [Chloroflexota bacterium]
MTGKLQYPDRPHLAWIALAGILVLALPAYFASLRYPYVQDGVAAVERNPVVERADAREIFASDYWKDTVSGARTLYRPVTVLGFAWERKIAGRSAPAVSRSVNLALHAGCAFLLFAYARRAGAGRRHALFAAWLFAAHPVLLQGVINVVGRADQLALLFGLLALILLSRAGPWPGRREPPASGQRLAAWGGALCLFLALGSKEVAVALPLLLVAQELLFRRREWTAPGGRVARLAALAPCALAMLVYLDLRTRALGEFPGLQVVPPEENVLVGLGGASRLATALAMAARYAGLLFLPARLSADYSGSAIRVETSPLAPLPLLGLLFLAALLLVAALPWLRRPPAGGDANGPGPWRAPAMGAWIFLAPYLVVGNLLVLTAAGFAERLLYVPAAGFCLMAAAPPAWCMARWPRSRVWVWAAMAALLVAGALQTRAEGRMWSSPRALFDHALASRPRSLRANLALAHRHRRQGNIDDAERAFRRCVELAPGDP